MAYHLAAIAHGIVLSKIPCGFKSGLIPLVIFMQLVIFMHELRMKALGSFSHVVGSDTVQTASPSLSEARNPGPLRGLSCLCRSHCSCMFMTWVLLQLLLVIAMQCVSHAGNRFKSPTAAL